MTSGSNFVARDGRGYERQMGRWSRRLAAPFADFAGIGSASERILDMGCGTGALTAELVRRSPESSVVGLDYSKAYVHYADDQGGGGRFLVADGATLPFSGGVLIPSPDVVRGPFFTDTAGQLTVSGSDLPALLRDVYTQWWMVDAFAPIGMSASGAVLIEAD